MQRNITKLEVVIADRSYTLLCEMESPLDHVKEALFQFQQYVEMIEDQARKNQIQEEEKTQQVSLHG